jgi:predicted porin
MKKSLIALAALATVATAAQAQSSVTIYGVMDLGYGSISNVGSDKQRVSGLQNGGLATSRLGFRGTEDLGGGLKAGFTLEAEILADTGTQTSTPEALFARESSVFLGGNFGELKLGRFNTVSYALAAKFDPLGANNIGGHIATGNYGYVRIENAAQYTTPVWNGFKATVQTGTKTQASSNGAATTVYGEVAGEFDGNRNTGAAIEYTAGKLELAATTAEQKTAAGVKETEVYSLLARYDFGVARVGAGYTETKTNATGVKVKKTYIGANVPVTAVLTLNAFASEIKNQVAGTTPKVYALGANYALSKRTTLYAIGAKSSQDGASTQALVNSGKWSYTTSGGTFTNGAAPAAGNDQTAYTVGIRHSF